MPGKFSASRSGKPEVALCLFIPMLSASPYARARRAAPRSSPPPSAFHRHKPKKLVIRPRHSAAASAALLPQHALQPCLQPPLPRERPQEAVGSGTLRTAAEAKTLTSSKATCDECNDGAVQDTSKATNDDNGFLTANGGCKSCGGIDSEGNRWSNDGVS